MPTYDDNASGTGWNSTFATPIVYLKVLKACVCRYLSDDYNTMHVKGFAILRKFKLSDQFFVAQNKNHFT
jgi:hypothetical protein